MEKGLNSYYWSAQNDYLYAKANIAVGREIGNYNASASLAAQSVEKFLKAIIEYYFVGDESCKELMKSHNAKALFSKVNTKLVGCPVSAKDFKWLGDFYFEARYPGENFILVTDEADAVECIRIIESLKGWVDNLPERERIDVSNFQKLEEFL